MQSLTKEILKGDTTIIGVKFKRNGAAISFASPPRWNLFNNNEEIILTGTAQAGTGTGAWEVTVTVPEDYELLTNPSEEMTLEVYGTDLRGVERSIDYPVLVADYVDDFLPEGVVWYRNQQLVDTLVTSVAIESVIVRIENAAGGVAFIDADLTHSLGTANPVRARGDVPDRFRSQPNNTTYQTDITFDAFDLPESIAPYLLIYEISLVGGGTESVVHQLYWTNNRIINMVMRQRSFLDKARLTEVDPTLQWWDPELVMAVYEGMQYVNSHPPEMTYWKASDMPQPLDTYWLYASALYSLNTRYLAEGMNAFEFTGLNTSLTSDRRDALSYKIDELKNVLDKLAEAKKSAVRVEGKGTPDPTAVAVVGRGAIGMLGLQASPVNNSIRLRTTDRLTRFRMFR